MSETHEQETDRDADAERYDITAVEQKWQRVWAELDPFRADDRSPREKRYALTMFPYPSGDLHMGHAEVFALHDVMARYWWLRGYEVLNPMGFDSFGLNAENAAIRDNEHPATFTYANIAISTESCRKFGTSFDWSRTLNTSDPEYYRWTQWLFLKFRERGLAYRKESPVNWCPVDQTVLANEQVIDGHCERCGAEVTKRELTQWYFRITEYAQELLDNLDALEPTWPDRVINAQRSWIGRSEGAHVTFEVVGVEPSVGEEVAQRPSRTMTVYTTRPDTLFGATFMVVAADARLAAELVTDEQRPAYDAYLEEVRKASDIERLSTDREKSGVFLGRYAVNPVNGQQIPIWAADYVLADYGTGAIMAVPGQDQRDWDFAERFDLPIVRTVQPPEGFEEGGGKAYVGAGAAINSANDDISLDGMGIAEAKSAIIGWLEQQGTGKGAVNFRLRDWLLSRQRYWGAPIPIVHCPACGEVPVPEDQLPVVLPELRGADLTPRGVSPLAAAEDWVNVDCPTCGGPAKRDSDTMDTFVDSSWYFLRYCSPHEQDRPFDTDLVNAWGPCDVYIGGVEHAVLHLLYARFFTMVLNDMGLVGFREPFSAQLNQGTVINEGAKMSKSKGNGVRLGEQLSAFGVDAVRLTLVFAGPPEDDIDWADMSPAGSLRFLQRAWRLSGDVTSPVGTPAEGGDVALRRTTAHTVHDAAELVDGFRFNVLVARVMELVNATRKAIDSGCGPADPAVREATEAVAILLSLVAPYTAEEMWERLGHEPTVARTEWPTVDPALLVVDAVTAVVQVKGKVKARLEVSPDITAADLEAQALADAAVVRAIEGREVRRVIVREPSLVNIVV